MLLKRDGGVVIENFLSPEIIDKTYDEIRPKMDNDREWKGNFFPVSSSVITNPCKYVDICMNSQRRREALV
jgi:hypothetical protein